MIWTYPANGHCTDSKSVYLLGSAAKSVRVNGAEIPLSTNGNFAYVYNLVFGENLISLEIDGQLETRIITAKASELTNPVAYAKPYAAWLDPNSKATNILRSVLVGENSISVPLTSEPKFKLERVDSKNYLLELNDMACDLDWVHYQAEVDNIVIREDNIVVQDSKILVPIEFDGELVASYEDQMLVVGGSLAIESEILHSRMTAQKRDVGHVFAICVDAGHGGTQLGAISPRGVCEKDLNLEVALKLRDELVKLGKQVIMTRETDIELSLSDRVAKAAQADLFISLHHNALPDARDPNQERGISLHYYHAHSRELAQDLLSDLCAATGLPRHGLYWQNLHVLRENPKRAVLIELGFLIHPEESLIVTDSGYQQLCVKTIAAKIN